jgi:flagellar hook-associated protein FlgK
MSDFFGLQVGLSALYASRRAMEVSAANVANANVDGYSRQRVTVSSAGAPLTAAVHARSDSQLSGVKVDAVIRTRDEFLAARLNAENANQKFLERQQTIFNRIELTFSEPSDVGIQAQLADFWAAWEDLSNNPGSLAARSQLIERAGTVVNSINHAAGELNELWRTSVQQLETIVKGVNATAARIAELNGSIKRATAAGLSPNELLDQRDNLALELAKMVGGEARADQLGTVGVYVGGTAIVRDEQFSELAVFVPTGTNIITADEQPVQLRWAKDQFPATVTGGESGALLDALNRILPTYREALVGGTSANQTFAGAPVAPAALQQDFSLAPASFLISVNAGPPVEITLDTNLTLATAADVAAAINDKLTAAGIANVTASGAVDGANWVFSLNGTGANIALSAAGTDPLVGNLFGANRPAEPTGLGYLLAKVTNEHHSRGLDLAGVQGGSFFRWTVTDGLRSAISDGSKIAAAADGEGQLGGGNALGLADLSLLGNGPDDVYRNLIIRLGVETQTVNRRVDIQQAITNQVSAARDAESGVNLDEELAFMVAFQHTFGAASRLITAIDEMLTRLINGTGLVGRG